MIRKPSASQLIIFSLALLNILIHLAVYDNFEYHRDELLYFAMGRHPDFGYATTPPLISWLASVLQFFLGFSLFAVKFLPALASGIIVLLTAAMAGQLGGRTYSQILAATTIIVTPLSLRTFHLFQPVFIDLILWTSLFYVVIRYLNSKNDIYFLIFGYLSGLAILNKYLVGVLFVSLFLALLLTKQTAILRKRHFYYGLAITFVMFLPNLIWQVMNDFRVFQHLQELNRYQLIHVNRIQFLMDQLLIPLAGSLLVIPGVIYLFINKKHRMLGYTAVFVVVILLILQGKSYYTLGIFPLLIAAGSLAAEKFIKSKFLRWTIPLLILSVSIPALPVGLPVFNPAEMVQYFKVLEENYGVVLGRTFEDGSIHSLPQDYADQLGWEELTQVTYRAYKNLENKSRTLIFAGNYGQASAITIIGKKYGLPEAISFNDTYWYWKPETLDPKIENVIYINYNLGSDVQSFFDRISIAGQIENEHAREYGLRVYLLQKPKSNINDLWLAAIKRESQQ